MGGWHDHRHDRYHLPEPEWTYPNAEINFYAKDSTPDFPPEKQAPEGAPNVLLVLIDDVGFGWPSVNGGLVRMPNAERLHERGLFYNQFHTTALCAPTRAAMLTGRNHHTVTTGVIQEMATGYPGYCGIIPLGHARHLPHYAPGWAHAGDTPFLWEGKVRYHHNYFGLDRSDAVADAPLAPGKHTIGLDFTPDEPTPGCPATATVVVDGEQVAQTRVERQVPMRCGTECFDVGQDSRSPVCDDHADRGLFASSPAPSRG